MPLYDLMLLLDPGAPSDRQETILRDVQGLLEKSGKVVGTYDWGTRRMTFEINHRPDAAYHLFQFETEGGLAPLEQVDHTLKIMDGVLRHRITRLKDGSPPPPMPSPDRRGGYGEEGGYGEAPAAAPEPGPEAGQPADAPAVAGTEQPAAPADAAAPALAETPPPADVADQEAGPAGGDDDEAPSHPAGGGGDDEAPSGPAAA